MDEDQKNHSELEFSKQSLEAIFDGIPDGIILLRSDLKIIRLNRKMLEWLKKESFQEVLGESYEKVMPSLLEVLPRTEFERICSETKPFYSGLPARLSQFPGMIFELCLFPIKNTEGNCGIILYLRDITNRVNLEAQLIELEKYKNIGPLARGVAHEIRNPLTLIQSIAQLTLSDREKDKELKENLESIIEHTKLANQVVTELMNFASPTSFEFEMVDSKNVLEEACHLIKSKCRKEKIELICDIESKIPLTKLDKNHFLQALLNFLFNGMASMEKGGKLTIRARRESQNIHIEIEDSGKGMSKFQAEHAFDPIFTTKKEGVGLGLFVARQIIDSHGGEVLLQSEENKGTKITILIPIVGEKAESKPEKQMKMNDFLKYFKNFFTFKKAA